MSDLKANRQKAMSDWSQLNHQVVGGEVIPMADHEKIELLKAEVVKLRAALAAAKEALQTCRCLEPEQREAVANALARIAECEKET